MMKKTNFRTSKKNNIGPGKNVRAVCVISYKGSR